MPSLSHRLNPSAQYTSIKHCETVQAPPGFPTCHNFAFQIFTKFTLTYTSVTSSTIRQLFQGNTAAVWRTWRTQQTGNNPEGWCHGAPKNRWCDSSHSWVFQDANSGSRTAVRYQGMGRVGPLGMVGTSREWDLHQTATQNFKGNKWKQWKQWAHCS